MAEDRPFLAIAKGLKRVGSNCTEACVHRHAGCPCDGHQCGCEHSADYEYEAPVPGTAEEWTESVVGSMLSFISRLDPDLSAEALADQLLHWWQGENRALRRKMERAHERVCSRGKGVLINRVTGESIRARCKSWRECSYCAWLYGLSVQRLFDQVKRLRAFVVFTMPPESGDWSKRESLVAQAQAKRRLEERLTRRFSRRFASCWTREHNTSGHGSGRLHLNVIWDEDWVDQEWLSETARACGFGRIVDISRIGERGRHAVRSGAGRGQLVSRYATKALRYSTKDLSSQTAWPKGTRRWGASRTARAQMKRPEKNPDWYFSLQGEVPSSFLPFDVNRYKAERSPLCLCLGPICFCGAPLSRVPISRDERMERIKRDRAGPPAAPA